MALIPGSYARAAGLQSEINKVTVTRVAGSEVQFQRTIDTYQKDLRYNVNQIQREQRQLRRSMRRYHHKLRQGKKDREQRQLQLQVQQRRSRRLAEEGRLLLPQILTLHDDDGNKDAAYDKGSEETQQKEQPHSNHTSSDQPDSNNSADALAESECQSQADQDVSSEKGSMNGLKPLLTRNKANAYFRSHKGLTKERSAKRKKTSDNEERTEGNDDGGDKDENGEDSVLPSITEEEEQNSQNTPGDETVPSASFGSSHAVLVGDSSSSSNPTGLENLESFTKSNTDTKLRSDHPVTLPSLNTKNIQRKASFVSGSNNDFGSTSDIAEHQSHLAQGASSSPAMTVARSPGKLTRRTGVSYGDLIKLQHTHTSSTKKLFNLVDRLASKHGIVDPPAADPSSRRKRYSSMDPRSNAKIKQRGQEQAQSLMSDGMVKQAAILYFIKYGYSQRDEEEPEELAESSALVTERAALVLDENPRSPEEHLKTRSVDFSQDGGGRKVGQKREAASARVSKLESHSVPASGDVSSLLSSSGTNGEPVQNSRLNRGRQSMSMLALSQQVTTIKSRSVDRHNLQSQPLPRRISVRSKSTTSAVGTGGTGQDPDALYDSFGEPVLQKLSPLPANLARSRRHSVRNLLHERLHEVGASSSGVAWQSAFGRLKMVHTLVDLTPYFVRDSP